MLNNFQRSEASRDNNQFRLDLGRKIVKVNDVTVGDQSRGMDRHNVLRAGCSLFLGLDILRPFDRGTFDWSHPEYKRYKPWRMERGIFRQQKELVSFQSRSTRCRNFMANDLVSFAPLLCEIQNALWLNADERTYVRRERQRDCIHGFGYRDVANGEEKKERKEGKRKAKEKWLKLNKFRLQIGSFFMINLCLVVIATQFSETKKREMERMRLERARFHSTSTLASSTNTSEPTTCYAEIVKWVYLKNLPRQSVLALCDDWRK